MFGITQSPFILVQQLLSLWGNKEKLQAPTVVKKSFRRRYCITFDVNMAIVAISTTIVDFSGLNPA